MSRGGGAARAPAGRRWAALAAAICAGACGYTFGSGLADRGVRTVAFQVVGNETYRQRMETEISHFLARELPVTTDLVLADAASADATLQVVLVDARERTLVIGAPDPAVPGAQFPRTREGAFETALRLRLVGRDGTVYVDRLLLDRTEFRSSIGENLTTARAESAEDLARKIALALETDF